MQTANLSVLAQQCDHRRLPGEITNANVGKGGLNTGGRYFRLVEEVDYYTSVACHQMKRVG